MRQEMMGFWGMEMALAGPYATICTSLQADNNTSTSSVNFYRPDALLALLALLQMLFWTLPTVSKH